MTDRHARTENYIFWDIVDYPPPENCDFRSFYESIREALRKEDCYKGHMSIRAYCERDNENLYKKVAYLGLPFRIIQLGNRFERLNHMALDMLEMLLWDRHGPSPKTFFLFLKDTPEDDSELATVVHSLSEIGCKFVLVLPDDDESAYPNMPPSCTRWPWNRLAAGKGPIPHSSSDDSDDTEEGSSPKRFKMNYDADDD